MELKTIAWSLDGVLSFAVIVANVISFLLCCGIYMFCELSEVDGTGGLLNMVWLLSILLMSSLAIEALCVVDSGTEVLGLATTLSLANDVLGLDCCFVVCLLSLIDDVVFFTVMFAGLFVVFF